MLKSMHLRKGFNCLLPVLALWIAAPAPVALANTEIVNFEASYSPDVFVPQGLDWPVLGPSNPETLLRVLPAPLDTPVSVVCEPIFEQSLGKCDHEAWLRFDLDSPAWASYSKFTLRISWPAMHPADFFIELYSPDALVAIADGAQGPGNSCTSDARLIRQKFARIRLVHGGVFTPSLENRHRTIEPVPFIVVVEPLYLGFLPASLVPTLIFLSGLVMVTGYVVVPRVNKLLFAVAEEVRAETSAVEERRKR
ncbi:hypothetical protein BD414DRAFT_492297 [Trametes punicea]|nr:hypothetical protein BD414DRAFT_492297 [Trametes punicea]